MKNIYDAGRWRERNSQGGTGRAGPHYRMWITAENQTTARKGQLHRNWECTFLNFTLHIWEHKMKITTSNPMSSVHFWLHVLKTCICWGTEVSWEALQKPHRFPSRRNRQAQLQSSRAVVKNHSPLFWGGLLTTPELIRYKYQTKLLKLPCGFQAIH